MEQSARTVPSPEPLRATVPELDWPATTRRIGRVRVPLAGPYRPWATLYVLPDGRRLWCLRLWEVDGPVRRCVPTSTLLSYARQNRLEALSHAIADVLARA